MTFKEKLQMEHPEMVDKRFGGGVKACPYHYGYEKNLNCMVWESNEKCEECWDREMPGTELEKVKEAFSEIGNAISKATEDVYKEDMNTAYNKGLNDAWEFMRKYAELTCRETQNVYGVVSLKLLTESFTPQEALAKLKAYEERIEVGDVVEYYKELGVVIFLNEKNCNLVFRDGAVSFLVEIGSIKKTGKHIDISSILEQIGGAE